MGKNIRESPILTGIKLQYITYGQSPQDSLGYMSREKKNKGQPS